MKHYIKMVATLVISMGVILGYSQKSEAEYIGRLFRGFDWRMTEGRTNSCGQHGNPHTFYVEEKMTVSISVISYSNRADPTYLIPGITPSTTCGEDDEGNGVETGEHTFPSGEYSLFVGDYNGVESSYVVHFEEKLEEKPWWR